MITRPKGSALTQRKGIWHIVYYENNKRKVRSLRTTLKGEAVRERDKFFAGVPEHVTTRTGSYVYRRPPWFVRVGKVFVGEAETEQQAIEMRDNYLTNRETT